MRRLRAALVALTLLVAASPAAAPLVLDSAASPNVAHVAQGELKGHQWQPRELAAANYAAGFEDAETLVVATAVELAESQGYSRAQNTNPDGSVDRGPWQLNSIHKDISDACAYDLTCSTSKAFSLWAARRSSFGDWAAYNSGVYLRDSYLGRAVVGVANMLADRLLQVPVPPHADGTPYVHAFTTPLASYQFRVVQGLIANQKAAKTLGWGAKSAAVVSATQTALAPGRTAVRKTIP